MDEDLSKAVDLYRRFKRYGGSAVVANVTNSSDQVIGPNPKRCGLVFGPADTGTVTLSPNSPAVAGSGFTRTQDPKPLVMHAREWGDLVTRAWHGISSVAASVVMVAEILEPNDA